MLITLITDFSDSGGFVAQIKITILKELPSATIVDVTHSITPFRPIEAAYILLSMVRISPPGSVHMVVVDPGVGTKRNILALEYKKQFIISPDNEALSLILPESVTSIDKTKLCPKGSSTFEARDVMARAIPVLLKYGPASLGGKTMLSCSNLLHPQVQENSVRGQIIHIDRFGNCISNIRENHLNNFSYIKIGKVTINRLSEHYCCGNEPKAIINANGFLEFAIFKGNFAATYNISYLEPVTVTLSK